MPWCMILTGYPCSGKTTVAEQIARVAREKFGHATHVLNEEICANIDKAASYATAHQEAQTRGTLKSLLNRTLARVNSDDLVILDSLNYIKGYRYELYCIAKECEAQYCVVHVLADWGIVQRNNTLYKDSLLESLVQRYERPDDRNRWDRPLYRVQPWETASPETTTSDNSTPTMLYNMHFHGSLTSATPVATAETPKPPKKSAFKRAKFKRPNVKAEPAAATNGESVNETTVAQTAKEVSNDTVPAPKTLSVSEQIDEILTAFFRQQPLSEGASTKQTAASDTLHDFDAWTLSVYTQIQEATDEFCQIRVGNETLEWRRCPVDQSIRQQFLAWLQKVPPQDSSRMGVAKSFLAYIQEFGA